jgi:hypothetical protein
MCASGAASTPHSPKGRHAAQRGTASPAQEIEQRTAPAVFGKRDSEAVLYRGEE